MRKYTKNAPAEPIDPDKMYPLAIVPKLFGIGVATLRTGEAIGVFRPHRVGSRKYAKGKALIEFIENYEQATREN